ncbi:WXG100 family type VII secretion target [Cellulomonas sp. NPDC089187]|uniref:WXG100 family type VII secretion target n=1 Tax=Cellulomonas sp. NPDC089187 TaxID=3154970 RepID=UPI00342E31FE
MSRPVDWHVVGLWSDPTPGDAWGVRQVARVYADTATAASQTLQLVRAVQSSAGTGIWHGQAGDTFRTQMEDFPEQIQACETSYQSARDAMNWWAGRLEDHQASADRGLEQARAADNDLRAAQAALQTAITHAQQASSTLSTIERDAVRYRNADPSSANQPPTPAQISRAQRASNDAAAAQRTASANVDQAQARLDAASRLVAEAAAAYDTDAHTTISKLDHAHDQALAENSIWDKIRTSGAWQALITIATIVVVIAAIAAFFLTGPIALIAGIIATVAGALLAINDVLEWQAGNQSGWQALLSVVLTVIPGGILLKAARGGINLATRIGLRLAPNLTTTITTALRSATTTLTAGINRIHHFTTPLSTRINTHLPGTNPYTGNHLYTGGAIRPRPRLESDQFSWAEDIYDSLRSDKSLAENIAAHIGFDVAEVRSGLNNVLVDFHRLHGGAYGPEIISRFDADPDIAEAFIRLSNGTPHASDLVLMRHEIAEAAYWQTHPNAHYNEAHAYAQTIADWVAAKK